MSTAPMPRRRPLLLFALLLAVAAAALTLLRRDAVKQELRDLRDTVRRPAGPASKAMPSEGGAPLISDGRTLTTNDPPPFDRPVAARSGPSIAIGDRRVRPNLHFDMESSADSAMLVSGTARSGRRSMYLRATDEYGPSIRRRAGDVGAPLTSIGVGLWCSSNEPGLSIVVTIIRGKNEIAWFGKDLKAHEHTPRTWQRLQAEFPVRGSGVSPDDVVTFYLWNRHHHEVWIDDMDVVFRSGDVLGRDSIRAHDLEDSARTTRPLPFATVECLGAADPVQAGVRVGDAPPEATALIALPDGPYRWRYAPGDGVARLIDGAGQARYLVRPWCTTTGDLLGFERVQVSADPGGLRIVGYDVDPAADGGHRVADTPAPRGALIRITAP